MISKKLYRIYTTYLNYIMRYVFLKINGKEEKNQRNIDSLLKSKEFYWLIDSEIENAKIEILNNTLIWHDGYFFGNWEYGIFKNGEFYGNWINGIFEGGKFNGNWQSGIKH